MICPHCGEENPERARFCLACGQSLVVEAPPGEERKVVSVLFVDLVGFTSRSDRADPEDVRATLRPYHERVKADIERFGGTVEKFIGDAVMAVFGAPVTHEDDAERAVRSALRILDTIEELRSEGLEISVRAAVTTGEAVVALGARPERGEGIVTGDVVNTAARLQSAAPVGAVIVDEPTRRSTESTITFEPLEPVAAKGKAEPIAVWRATHARSRVGQPEAATHAPFVGREHERALLSDTFSRAERESSVQLVTIIGEPGIGKSRLVTELRTALDDRPDLITWRHGRCLPYGEGITFWALGEIVKAEAGILESDDQHIAASKLDECVSALFADESEQAWFVSRLAPLVGSGGDGAAVSREEAFTAWRRFLEAMAARRPCVLVVEDLHWADGALLEFLEHLLDWSMPVPLLLLCTARPELFERQPSWGGGKRNATTISLAPLSTEDASRLLQVLLDRTLLPVETQSVLLERAGGNPLYAEQFARMLSERGDVEDLAVPETVQALMAARIDTLRPELKALLHDAAVVGRIFWSGALAAIGERDRDEVRRDLNELVRREFVRPVRLSSVEGDDEFSFWHALVRDVAYQQIPRTPRADKHVAAAVWIETTGERLEDQAETLVHHYGEALELMQAVGEERPELAAGLQRCLLLAADRADQLDTERALTYLGRALDLAGDDELARAYVLAKLAPVLAIRGDEGALDACEHAIRVLRDSDPPAAAAVLTTLSRLHWAGGRMAESEAAGEEGIAILERAPGPHLVEAYGSMAHQLAIAGKTERAMDYVSKGLAVADELEVADIVALVQARATVRGYRSDPRALDDLRESVELGRRLGLGRATAIAMNNLAEGLLIFESLPASRAAYDDAIAFSRSRGLVGAEVWQRGERLRTLYHAGDWDELEQEAHEVLTWVEERSGGQLAIFAHVELVQLLVHRGELARAREHVDALLPRARESGDPQVLAPGLTVAALLSWRAGDERTAIGLITEIEEKTRTAPLGWRSSICLTWPTRIAIALGRQDLSDVFLAGDPQPTAWDGCARPAARAATAEAHGHTDEAARLYREAAGRWLEFGSVVEQAYALLGLGRCGDVKAAREGNAIFARLGASPVVAQAA